MSLKDRINEDMKTAMRAKDGARLSTIRMLLAALKQKEVDERITLSDADVVAVVDKLIKQRRDSVDAYQKAQRNDLADKEAAEIAVLQAYLPERLDAAAVAAAVSELLAELNAQGAGDMGRVMTAAKARLAGKADMSAVAQAVKAALSGKA
ncbi:MAG: GatB/YqeY domain-containing protein [Rhodoferax sp.]